MPEGDIDEWSVDYDPCEAYSLMTELPASSDSRILILTSFNTNSFPPLQRILHHMFTTIITPQGGGRCRLTETQRFLFYCLMKNIKVNLASVMMDMLSECLENHHFWPYAAHLTAFFRKRVPLDNELCKAISRSNIYNLNFLLTFMKFCLVDGVLQRNLVSPSSLQDLPKQHSQEQVLPPAEQVPSVEQLQPESSSVVPDEALHVPKTVLALSPVHLQEEPTLVSLLETQPQVLIDIPILEPPVTLATHTGEHLLSSSEPQPPAESSHATSHESSHEQLHEPIHIDDSPQHSVDTYHPPNAYAQVFAESSQPQPPQDHVPSVQHSVLTVQKDQSSVPSSTSTPTEWHRQGISTQPTVSAPDPSVQENFVLFRFISA